MDTNRIAEILTEELSYIYCDNCRNVDDDSSCDECNRKAMKWQLSEQTALKIAEKIGG